MSERLRPRDLTFLAEETPATPTHHAMIEILDPGEAGLDFDRLVELVADRLPLVPRYRQRIQQVPGRLANPVWVDDDRFDLAYHVRRSALPHPGSRAQLLELVARIVSRPLDRSRPLWEIYCVEGLEEGRAALLYKTHQALVDGVDTVDLGQILVDADAEARPLTPDDWRPQDRPSPAGLLSDAVRDSLLHPTTALDTLRGTAASVLRGAEQVTRQATQVVHGLTGNGPERATPISGPLSQQRLVVVVDTSLSDYRTVRDAHGCSVNDVVLATVTGGLRGWLMSRQGSMRGRRSLRAVVPVSVIDRELEATSLVSQLAAHFVELPTGEASPVIRLAQVSYSFEKHRETGRAVPADRLAAMTGFAPATFHAMGARLAASESRSFALSISHVPGPQSPLYTAGARMVATYPVQPLLPGRALAIGVTSYDGCVHYGITADRDRLPDADLLGQCISEALTELLDTATSTRPRAPRGRPQASRSSAGAT